MKKYIRLNEVGGPLGGGGDGAIISADSIDYVTSALGGRFITTVYYTTGDYIQIRHGNDYGDTVLSFTSLTNSTTTLLVGADGAFGPSSGVEVGQLVFNDAQDAFGKIASIGDNGSGTNNALTLEAAITGQGVGDAIKIVVAGTQLKVVKAFQEALPKISSKNWREAVTTVDIGQPVTRITSVF